MYILGPDVRLHIPSTIIMIICFTQLVCWQFPASTTRRAVVDLMFSRVNIVFKADVRRWIRFCLDMHCVGLSVTFSVPLRYLFVDWCCSEAVCTLYPLDAVGHSTKLPNTITL